MSWKFEFGNYRYINLKTGEKWIQLPLLPLQPFQALLPLQSFTSVQDTDSLSKKTTVQSKSVKI